MDNFVNGFLIFHDGKFLFRQYKDDQLLRAIKDREFVDYELRVDDLPVAINLNGYYSMFEEGGKKYIGYAKRNNVHLFDIEVQRNVHEWSKTNWGGDDVDVVMGRVCEIVDTFEQGKTDYATSIHGVRVLDSDDNVLYLWERENVVDKVI